jgi:phage/plasmid-associated DNA primase
MTSFTETEEKLSTAILNINKDKFFKNLNENNLILEKYEKSNFSIGNFDNNNIKITEILDLHKIKYIQSMKLGDMKEIFDKCKNIDEIKINFNKVKKYCDRLIQNNGEVINTYKYSINNSYGRLFSSSSIQSISYKIRGFLFKHTTDFDFSNCHPKILLYICKKYNITHTNLEYYCNNREEILERGNKDEIKLLILKFMNDCNINNNLGNNRFLIELDREFKYIQNELIKIKEFNFINDTIPENRNNFNGSFINKILCYYENLILQDMIYILKKEGKELAALMFDGCMINGNYYNNEGVNLIEKIEEYINNKWNCLNIKIKMKEHDNSIKIPEGWTPIYDKYNDIDLFNPSFTTGLLSGFFKKLYNEKYIFSNNRLYYFNEVCWLCDDINNSNIHMFINNIFYKEMVNYTTKKLDFNNKNPNIELQDKQNITIKLNNLLTNIQKLTDISFREKLVKDIKIHITNNDIKWNTNHMLFSFKNKIYDLELGNFIIPNPLDYININTGYNYEDIHDLDSKKKDLYKLLKTIFKDDIIRDYYLEILATGLCGTQLENLFIATGAGGNGKGLLNSLMMNCIGNYGYILPSSVLATPLKLGGDPQVFGLNGKRFVLCSEPDSKKDICCSTIKDLTGDGKINVRDNYGTSDDCGITINMSLIMECNDLPRLDETNEATSRRIRAIPFNSIGVDKDTFDKYTSEEIDDNNYFVINPYYKTLNFQETYKQVFFHILVDYFNIYKNNNYILSPMPDDCKKLTISYMASSDYIYSWFNEMYELDDDSYIYITDIFNDFKQGQYYDGLSKAEKSKIKLSSFSINISKNLFLKRFYKKRYSYINFLDDNKKKIRIQKECLIGWKLKIDD